MAERWRDRGKGERGEGERCHWVRIFVNGMDGGCLGRLPRVGVESCYSLIRDYDTFQFCGRVVATTWDESCHELPRETGKVITSYHESR